jgi:hypothetical protein
MKGRRATALRDQIRAADAAPANVLVGPDGGGLAFRSATSRASSSGIHPMGARLQARDGSG